MMTSRNVSLIRYLSYLLLVPVILVGMLLIGTRDAYAQIAHFPTSSRTDTVIEGGMVDVLLGFAPITTTAGAVVFTATGGNGATSADFRITGTPAAGGSTATVVTPAMDTDGMVIAGRFSVAVPSGVTTRSIRITATPDSIDEFAGGSTDTVVLTLVSVSGGVMGPESGQSTSTVSIFPSLTASLVATKATATEGGTMAGRGEVTLRLTSASGNVVAPERELMVVILLSNVGSTMGPGTGRDYNVSDAGLALSDIVVAMGATLTVTFGANETERKIPVLAFLDTPTSPVESGEGVTFTLRPVITGNPQPVGISVSTTTAMVTLQEQPAIMASFERATYAAYEEGALAAGVGVVDIAIILDRVPGRSVTIPVTLSNFGATRGTDYAIVTIASSGTVTVVSDTTISVVFGEGSTRQVIKFNAAADSMDNEAEVVEFGFGDLSSLTDVTAGTSDSTRVEIKERRVFFEQTDYVAYEGGAAITVAVVADPPFAAATTVSITRTGLGATIETSNPSLSFGAGDRSKSFTVTAAVDRVSDTDESVGYAINDISGVIEGGAATVNLVDVQARTVSFGDSSFSVLEGSSVQVDVILSTAIGASELHVPVTVTSLTTAESSYRLTSGMYSVVRSISGLNTIMTGIVVFKPGEALRKLIQLEAVNDSNEGNEPVTFAFGMLPAGVLVDDDEPAMAIVTIVDDDPMTGFRIAFVQDSYVATEGGAAARVEIILSRPSGNSSPISIPFRSNPGRTETTASDADYRFMGFQSQKQGELVFRSGEDRKAIVVVADDDSAAESDEEVGICFTNTPPSTSGASASCVTATGGTISVGSGSDAVMVTLVGNTTSTVTLEDNDSSATAITASFGSGTSSAYSVKENEAVQVRVTLSKVPGREVRFRVRSGITTAITDTDAGPGDYTLEPSTLVFRANEREKIITLRAILDSESESSESLMLSFTGLPSGITAGTPATSTVTITDGVRPIEVFFDFPSYTLVERASGDTTTATTAAVRLSGDLPSGQSIGIRIIKNVTGGSDAAARTAAMTAVVVDADGATSTDTPDIFGFSGTKTLQNITLYLAEGTYSDASPSVSLQLEVISGSEQVFVGSNGRASLTLVDTTADVTASGQVLSFMAPRHTSVAGTSDPSDAVPATVEVQRTGNITAALPGVDVQVTPAGSVIRFTGGTSEPSVTGQVASIDQVRKTDGENVFTIMFPVNMSTLSFTVTPLTSGSSLTFTLVDPLMGADYALASTATTITVVSLNAADAADPQPANPTSLQAYFGDESYSVSEGDSVYVDINLTAPAPSRGMIFHVQRATAGGTAGFDDFIVITADGMRRVLSAASARFPVSFRAGQIQARFKVEGIEDRVAAGAGSAPETVVLSIPTSGLAGRNSTTVHIHDDGDNGAGTDRVVLFEADQYYVHDAGGAVNINLALLPPLVSPATASVSFEVRAFDASGNLVTGLTKGTSSSSQGGYTVVVGTSYTANNVGFTSTVPAQTITLTAVAADLSSKVARFELMLTPPDGVTAPNPTATITVLDGGSVDTALPRVSFGASRYTAIEGRVAVSGGVTAIAPVLADVQVSLSRALLADTDSEMAGNQPESATLQFTVTGGSLMCNTHFVIADSSCADDGASATVTVRFGVGEKDKRVMIRAGTIGSGAPANNMDVEIPSGATLNLMFTSYVTPPVQGSTPPTGEIRLLPPGQLGLEETSVDLIDTGASGLLALQYSYAEANYSALVNSDTEITVVLNRAPGGSSSLTVQIGLPAGLGSAYWLYMPGMAGVGDAEAVPTNNMLPLTFGSNESAKSFVVYALRGGDLEFGISSAGAVVRGIDSTMLRVRNDYVVNFVDERASTVREGASMEVSVEISPPPQEGQSISIPLVATPLGGAFSSDYTVTIGSSVNPYPLMLTFEPGDGIEEFTVAARDDGEDDDEESVRFSFGSLPSGVDPGSRMDMVVQLNDNDNPSVEVSFGSASYNLIKGVASTIGVGLDKVPEREVVVTVTAVLANTANGLLPITSGTPPVTNYVTVPILDSSRQISLTFSASDTRKSFTVTPNVTSMNGNIELTLSIMNESGGTGVVRVINGARESTTLVVSDRIRQDQRAMRSTRATLGAVGRVVAQGSLAVINSALTTAASTSSLSSGAIAGQTLPSFTRSSSPALEEGEELSYSSRAVTYDELLSGSNFTLKYNGDGSGDLGIQSVTTWMRGDIRFLEGSPLSGFEYDGTSYGIHLGSHVQLGQSLEGLSVGLSFAYEWSAVDFTDRSAGSVAGEIESGIFSVRPYAEWVSPDNWRAWGMVGFGTGEISIAERVAGRSSKVDSDADLLTAGGGLEASIGEWEGFDFTGRGSFVFSRFDVDGGVYSDKSQRLPAFQAEAWGLQGDLEASYEIEIEGGTIEPFGIGAVRIQGDDDDSQLAVDLGGGVRAELQHLRFGFEGRTQVTSGDHMVHGLTVNMSYDYDNDGRGLLVLLQPNTGLPSGLSEWSVEANAPRGGFGFEAEIGYGFEAAHPGSLLKPYVQFGLTEQSSRFEGGLSYTMWGGVMSLQASGRQIQSLGADRELQAGLRSALNF